MVDPVARVGWGEHGLLPDCPPPDAAVVVDSFLLANGRVAGLNRHETRFWASCAALSLDATDERISRFLTDVRPRLPRSGRWFVRFEGHRGSPAPLVLWLRPAPQPQLEIRLWNGPDADPRRFPRCKGPDLAALAALRERARAEGADDAVLRSADGTVLETAHAGLLWWRGDQLCFPEPLLPRLASVTSELLLDHVRRTGGAPRPERVRLDDLADAEVWTVNTLHGIRPVTGWVGDGCPPQTAEPDADPGRERLAHYRGLLRAAARRLDDLADQPSG